MQCCREEVTDGPLRLQQFSASQQDADMVLLFLMKSTKVQTSPIYRNYTLEHLPQSTEPRAVLGSKYVMAKPA